MQVGMFSGCSSHSLWSMFFSCSVSASTFRVVSSGAYKEGNRMKRNLEKAKEKKKKRHGGRLLSTESGGTALPKKEL